jgi:ubiquinone/menaquinone biosynthesis C-methylase UbiE
VRLVTQDQTRASYDAVAAAYAEALSDELARKPLDRALLTAFAEQVREVGRGERRVWDVGCGPGHVTAFLAGLGVRAEGVDLSGEMTAQAAKRHPDLTFSTGSLTVLPAADASWDGLVSFYSLIHMIDDADLRAALAELRRVLVTAGCSCSPCTRGRRHGTWRNGSAPRSTCRSASSIPPGSAPNSSGPASPSNPSPAASPTRAPK